MAAKKRKKASKPRSSNPSQRGKSKRSGEDLIEGLTPEQRAMLLGRFLDEVSGPPGELDEGDSAYDLIESIDESTTPEEARRIAEEALELDPDCVNAYLVLSDLAGSTRERLELLEAALTAAERELGPETFEEDKGHFWMLLETRMYMRVREELAMVLWSAGRRDEAADHLQAMLELNPNDNQGLRYVLASWLASLDRDAELGALLERYPENSSMMLYATALYLFRRDGDSPESRRELTKAKKANRHVPAYLLGRESLSRTPPDSYTLGSREEAQIYAREAMPAWRDTPGALGWLRETLGIEEPRPSKVPEAVGPNAKSLASLRKVTQKPDNWILNVSPVPHWEEVDGEPRQVWCILIASRNQESIVMVGAGPGEPSAERVWDYLEAAIRKPAAGKKHRPTVIEVTPGPWSEALEAPLQAVGVEMRPLEPSEILDELMEGLGEFFGSNDPVPYTELPGVTVEQVADLYAAAASYRRAAPWKSMGTREFIEIASDGLDAGTWYACVMGEAGMVQGLALYDDLDLLHTLYSGELAEEESAFRTRGLVLSYEPEDEIPKPLRDDARRHAFELAHRDAYPLIYFKDEGMSIRPPESQEIDLIIGCLRAIPAFLEHNPRSGDSPRTLTAPTYSGSVSFRLRLVE